MPTPPHPCRIVFTLIGASKNLLHEEQCHKKYLKVLFQYVNVIRVIGISLSYWWKRPLSNLKHKHSIWKWNKQLLLRTQCTYQCQAGRGEAGLGRDFDIFPKIAVKLPTPGNNFWSWTRTKIRISLLPGQQDNSNALPPSQSDQSNPRPMPRLPPRRLDIDRYTSQMQHCEQCKHFPEHNCLNK